MSENFPSYLAILHMLLIWALIAVVLTLLAMRAIQAFRKGERADSRAWLS